MTNDMQWIRSIVSPIVVAIVVGLGTSYLAHSVAFAKFEERLNQHEREIRELRAETKGVAVLQERVLHLSNQIDRLERKLDHNNKSMMLAP